VKLGGAAGGAKGQATEGGYALAVGHGVSVGQGKGVNVHTRHHALLPVARVIIRLAVGREHVHHVATSNQATAELVRARAAGLAGGAEVLVEVDYSHCCDTVGFGLLQGAI
jgi:hypothetical protein